MFTLDNLAAELGIDPATLQAKPDAVAKWNGYLSQADTQYREAKESLEQARRDQAAIDEQIKTFGVTEARVTELSAANAAYKAALLSAKSQGLNIDLAGIPDPAALPAVDPAKNLEQTLKTGFSQMGEALRVQSRYHSIYGKPFTDDPVKLVDEAIAARMPVSQYAEQKYKFAEETEKQAKAEFQRKLDEGVQAGVKKWQEDHPVTAGHRGMTPGVASRHPQVFKPRSAEETRDFRKLSPRERIAASVGRVREAIASNAE
jgi:hypothetical protein